MSIYRSFQPETKYIAKTSDGSDIALQVRGRDQWIVEESTEGATVEITKKPVHFKVHVTNAADIDIYGKEEEDRREGIR